MNATLIFFYLEIEIEITPCITTQVVTPQQIDSLIVYYMQPQTPFYWREFYQFPACNYTWEYEVFVRQAPRASSNFGEYKQLD